MNNMTQEDTKNMSQMILLGEYGGAIKLWRSCGGDKLDLLSSIIGLNQVLFQEFRSFILHKYEGTWNE
jgi:hypothetical protein